MGVNGFSAEHCGQFSEKVLQNEKDITEIKRVAVINIREVKEVAVKAEEKAGAAKDDVHRVLFRTTVGMISIIVGLLVIIFQNAT